MQKSMKPFELFYFLLFKIGWSSLKYNKTENIWNSTAIMFIKVNSVDYNDLNLIFFNLLDKVQKVWKCWKGTPFSQKANLSAFLFCNGCLQFDHKLLRFISLSKDADKPTFFGGEEEERKMLPTAFSQSSSVHAL